MQEGKPRTDGLRASGERPADVVIAFLDAEVRMDEGELRRDRDLADGRRLRQTGKCLVRRKRFEVAVSRGDQIDPRHKDKVVADRLEPVQQSFAAFHIDEFISIEGKDPIGALCESLARKRVHQGALIPLLGAAGELNDASVRVRHNGFDDLFRPIGRLDVDDEGLVEKG